MDGEHLAPFDPYQRLPKSQNIIFPSVASKVYWFPPRSSVRAMEHLVQAGIHLGRVRLVKVQDDGSSNLVFHLCLLVVGQVF